MSVSDQAVKILFPTSEISYKRTRKAILKGEITPFSIAIALIIILFSASMTIIMVREDFNEPEKIGSFTLVEEETKLDGTSNWAEDNHLLMNVEPEFLGDVGSWENFEHIVQTQIKMHVKIYNLTLYESYCLFVTEYANDTKTILFDCSYTITFTGNVSITYRPSILFYKSVNKGNATFTLCHITQTAVEEIAEVWAFIQLIIYR